MKRTYSLDLFPYGTSITSQYFFDSQCQDSARSFDLCVLLQQQPRRTSLSFSHCQTCWARNTIHWMLTSLLSISPCRLSWHLQWDRKPRCLSTQYQPRTCFRLKSLWGGWPSMDPSLFRWWCQSNSSRKRLETRLCRNRSGLCISPRKRP